MPSSNAVFPGAAPSWRRTRLVHDADLDLAQPACHAVEVIEQETGVCRGTETLTRIAELEPRFLDAQTGSRSS